MREVPAAQLVFLTHTQAVKDDFKGLKSCITDGKTTFISGINRFDSELDQLLKRNIFLNGKEANWNLEHNGRVVKGLFQYELRLLVAVYRVWITCSLFFDVV